LKRAREARELDLQEVADVLNLSARTVSLLEAEAWSELPRPAFTRGYLRTFARLVGENPDQILDAYAAAAGRDAGAAPLNRTDVERRAITEVIHKQPGVVLSVSVLAAALVAGVVLWTVWPEENARPRETPTLRPPTTQPRTAGAPKAPGVDTAQRQAPRLSPPTRQPSETPPPLVAETAAAPSDAVASSSSEPQDTAPPLRNTVVQREMDPDDEELTTIVEDVAATARVKRITPEGNDSLSLTFTGDCWVEVKNGEGESLYSDLSRSGDVLELVGEAPFRLRLGFAPGVELAFNHERVVLTPHTRNNIASIVLGQ
jgi:cytoskeleton protein RodZ